MPLSNQQPSARLRALRRSHCRTCGCPRCRRIDQFLEQAGQPLDSHPETNGAWLLEGRMLPDGQGGWAIQSASTVTTLNEALLPWAGHHVIVLIGTQPAPQSQET